MFKRQYRRQWCESCSLECSHRRKYPNHLFHGLLTLCSLGLWGVSWISVTIAGRFERWVCLRCRAAQRPATAEEPQTASSAPHLAPPRISWT